MNQIKSRGIQIGGRSISFILTAAVLVAASLAGPNLTAQFYSLTVNSNGSGSVTKSPNQFLYGSGSSVQLTALPDAGWTFSNWSGDLSGSTNPQSIIMDGDKTVTASFTQDIYSLNITVVGQGSVDLNPAGGSYLSGTDVEMTPVPDPGWEFSGWSVDFTGDADPASITMNSNKNVTATFTEILYPLTVNSTGQGTVSLNPAGGSYTSNTTVTLTASADPGWSFSGWSGDASGTSNPTQVIMTGPKTVNATFTQNSYSLTLSTSGQGSATQNPPGPSHLSFTDVEIQATPNAGWTFTGWTGDLTSSSNPETVIMDNNKLIIANFSQNTYQLTLQTDGTPGATVSPSDPVNVAHGQNQTIIATAPAGYVFTEWKVTSGTGATIANSNLATTTVTLTQSDVTVEASFELKKYTLSVITDGTPGSAVSPSSSVQVDHGIQTGISVTSVPEGYEFLNWSVVSGTVATIDDPTNPTTTATLTQGNATIQATFVQSQYQLTVQTDETPGATVNPANPVQVVHGQSRTIIATAPVGYAFKEWVIRSGQGAAVANLELATTTITLTLEDVVVEATFERKKYFLTVITDGTAGAAVSPVNTVQVDHGQPRAITVTSTPAGYQFMQWMVSNGGGVNIANDTAQSTTVTLTQENATVQALFEQKQYSLTLVTDGTPGATVSPFVPVTVTHGQAVGISANVPTGYKFTRWVVISGNVTIGNDTLTATTATLTSTDVVLRATYELKQYTLSLTTDGTPGAAVSPSVPVRVQHGIPYPIEVTTVPVGYKFRNWNLINGTAAFGNDTLESTTATLSFGDATARANFQKVLQVLNVQITNQTMKIGDMVTVTFTVSNDAGTPYSLLSGTIGGYPLNNFLRQNATTYRASFTIVEGGNSYPALADIPVVNLILSDGTIQNPPYNKPIIQNNDAIDAKYPVINSMTVAATMAKVGDVVRLNINADGTGYTSHPNTTINGISITEPNVTFTELTNGNYRLNYTVREGDDNVAAGELAASVILVKPSGNVRLVPYTLIEPNNLEIDAQSPVVTRLEVSQEEVGVGGTVQLVISADGEGYTGASGTVINGVPISSSRVSLVEQTPGLYVLNYMVGKDDNEVATGELKASVVMTDEAGNNSTAYSTIVDNELEIYTDLPGATLAGPPAVCEDEPAQLTVFLSGRAPWGFDLNDGTTVTSYKFINEPQYKIPISLAQTTTFSVDSVWDRNAVVNAGSGSIQVLVNEKADLQIMNIAPGYNVEDPPFELMGVPSGGTFTGPGVVPATGFFYPDVAGTENSPHQIYYTYENESGCLSVDSALVFVLAAEGDIFIPDSIFCNNSEPVTITASNLAGATGSFTLADLTGNEVAGMTDNGDNTALLSPALLSEGSYVVVYEYSDGVALFLEDTFAVRSVEIPEIIDLDTVFCQNDPPVELTSTVPNSIFSGPGVSGSIDGGFMFYPDSVKATRITLVCTVTDAGCSASAEQEITIRLAPKVGFDLSPTCISDDGGEVIFSNTTGDKLQVEKWLWNFGDPGSGEENLSTEINPSHFFANPGPRSISLTATTYNGCVVTNVMDTVLGNQPVADFTWESNCYAGEAGTTFLNRSSSEFSPLAGTKFVFRSSDGLVLGDVVSETHLETANFIFGQAGEYEVELRVESASGCIDTAVQTLSLSPTVVASPDGFTESFNEDMGQWSPRPDKMESSWTWDEPDWDGFSSTSGDKAWYTDLQDAGVTYEEYSWLQSPCYDLSAMDRPMIKMEIMKSFASGNGAVLQYMDQLEEGWKTVGSESTGIGWYNNDNVSLPDGSTDGWGWDVFNPDEDWVTAAHNLDDIADSPYVIFRIALTMKGEETNGNQGFAFDNLLVAERSKRAVLEHFTNSSDPASKAADDVIDQFGSGSSGDVVHIQYHMDYPGFDPMNENNPVAASTRSFNYGIPQVPYAVLDGGISEEYRYDFSGLKTTPSMESAMWLTLQEPLFDVELEVNWLEGLLETTATVTCNVDSYEENIQLYVVIFETSVTAYAGLNGDTLFRNVVLDMLPTPAGKLLGNNWVKGNSVSQTESWLFQPYVEDEEDLAVVAFVQDRTTKQILQADVKYKSPQVGTPERTEGPGELHIYPNPARSLVNVNLGRDQAGEGRLEIIDMNGRLALQQYLPPGYQVIQMDIAPLQRGFYVIRWYEEGSVKGLAKLIKID